MKLFSYSEPISVSERNYKKNKLTPSINKTKYKPKPVYTWKNAWNAKPQLFSNRKYHKPDIKTKKRMKIYSERLYISIYKMIQSLNNDHPIKLRWIKIKDKYMDHKESFNGIFDNVVSHFSNINKENDLLWIGAKYSPHVPFVNI